MPIPSYEAAEALVYDPVAVNRGATRSALAAIGFRQIEAVASVSDFARAIYRLSPDLIVCEVQTGEMQVCDQIQAMRNGMTGYNPFVVVIATTWDKSKTMVRRVIDSGADDLILRPFSNGILASRIEAATHHRKGFVITHDYIGPDRRRDPGRVSAVLFEPPNSLAMKADGRQKAEAEAKQFDEELRAARAFLSGEKIRRDAFQTGVLLRLMETEEFGREKFEDYIARLTAFCRAISRRSREVQLSGAQMWCDMAMNAIGKLGKDGDRTEAMRLLDRAVQNLNRIASPEKDEKVFWADIEAAIAAKRSHEVRHKAQ
jgi:CheY-like chemotaxis protein